MPPGPPESVTVAPATGTVAQVTTALSEPVGKTNVRSVVDPPPTVAD